MEKPKIADRQNYVSPDNLSEQQSRVARNSVYDYLRRVMTPVRELREGEWKTEIYVAQDGVVLLYTTDRAQGIIADITGFEDGSAIAYKKVIASFFRDVRDLNDKALEKMISLPATRQLA